MIRAKYTMRRGYHANYIMSNIRSTFIREKHTPFPASAGAAHRKKGGPEAAR